VRTIKNYFLFQLIADRKLSFKNSLKHQQSESDQFKPQIFIDQMISMQMNENNSTHLTDQEIEHECYTMVAAVGFKNT
jgi:hypothetical protein